MHINQINLTLSTWSLEKGVYAVVRKWHCGVGMSEDIMPTKSLFIYPGYLNVVVLADMTVDTYTEHITSVHQLYRASQTSHFLGILTN